MSQTTNHVVYVGQIFHSFHRLLIYIKRINNTQRYLHIKWKQTLTVTKN